jgi:hypothetical protein
MRKFSVEFNGGFLKEIDKRLICKNSLLIKIIGSVFQALKWGGLCVCVCVCVCFKCLFGIPLRS